MPLSLYCYSVVYIPLSVIVVAAAGAVVHYHIMCSASVSGAFCCGDFIRLVENFHCRVRLIHISMCNIIYNIFGYPT